jgi:16S rRNA (guanine527-N7)-methyltransferase
MDDSERLTPENKGALSTGTHAPRASDDAALQFALAEHRRVLESWRNSMDLVGPGPVDPHFEDANEAVRTLDVHGRWLDLGSGAGFPGIALAAWHPHAAVTLVERRQKRAAFLEVVLGAGRLSNASVHCGDADQLPIGWDGMISRAFRAPQEVAALATRLLLPGGRLVLMLARDESGTPPGFIEEHVHSYTIDGKGRRAVVLRRP